MNRFIIGGIGTDVGKTVCSAIIVRLLKAAYWKPISSGSLNQRDTNKVQELNDDFKITCYPEAYHFLTPVSPHQAAYLENIEIDPKKIIPPKSDKPLIIESAGGVLVPIAHNLLTVDLFSSWNFPWIIVSKNYLGSINHTLLTIEALKTRKANILGLIFVGHSNPFSESFILENSKLTVLGRINHEKNINSQTIQRYCSLWKKIPFWNTLLQKKKII